MFARADLPHGITLRASRPGDAAFLRMLHDAKRWDLQFVEGDPDFVQSLYDLQHRAESEGYGEQFPEACYYVIERAGAACGRLVLDFGSNEVRIVDLALIPEAQGRGIGRTVIQAMQRAAAAVPAPVTLTVQRLNARAYRTYETLGFQPVPGLSNPAIVHMAWVPGAATAGAGAGGGVS